MRNRIGVRSLAFVVGGLLAVAPASAEKIKVKTTADTTGGEKCSLRDAISAANTDTAVGDCKAGSGADRIELKKGETYTLSLAGAGDDDNLSGDLDIWEALEIDGRGATIDGAGLDRVFDVMEPRGAAPPTRIGISSLHIINGNASSDGGGLHVGGGWHVYLYDSFLEDNVSAGAGGGADVDTQGALTLQRCTVRGNTAAFAGGLQCGSNSSSSARILVDSTTVSDNVAVPTGPRTGDAGGIGIANGCQAVVVNSTVSSNSVSGAPMALQGIAGGIGVVGETASPRLELINSTVANNSASLGGGVAAFVLAPAGGGTEVIFENTIVAGNTDMGGAKSCTTGGTPALLTSLGHNLEDASLCNFIGPGDLINVAMPGLGPLAYEGGPTETHALLDGSPALDAGEDTTAASPPVNGLDQRGTKRPRTATDIGAYERN